MHLQRRHRLHLFSSLVWKQRLLFLGGALVVGSGAAAFAIICERTQQIFEQALTISPLLPLFITPLGFMLAAFLVRRFFPGAQGSGIPQVVAGRQTKDQTIRRKLLSLRVAAGKLLLTPFAILVGASIGREGPTVQIGAAIMLASGRFFGRGRQHGLVLAGGAAGIAAAFNTPLAGIVFAIEELSRSFERRANGLILTAIIFSGISSIAILGNYTYFGTTSASIGMAGFPSVIVCGLSGGLMGGIFSRLLVVAARGALGFGIGGFMRRHPVWFAGICGFCLAVIGIASGNVVYGTGYSQARALLEQTAAMPWYFGIAKMAATVLSSISGIAGGLFAPSLAAGAGFGANIAAFLPGTPVGAIVILGMVSYFAGVVQAPITAFVIVFEMTNNHDMVVPIMAAALIGSTVSRLVCRHPVYHALAETALEQVMHSP